MEFSRTKKIVHYKINGKLYDRIEDAPPEFQEMLRALKENPDALKNSTVSKVTTTSSLALDEEEKERPHEDFREKFLHETVLPNLHLLDPKAQAEVLRAISGDQSEKTSSRSTIFWVIFYAALGLLVMYGISAIKKLVSAP